ncbi:MAG: hypothetical protein P8L37_05945 [Phycisphaerales bacterium]|nr:hypothetical protein [Phycisphaerales bacterium]
MLCVSPTVRPQPIDEGSIGWQAQGGLQAALLLAWGAYSRIGSELF